MDRKELRAFSGVLRQLRKRRGMTLRGLAEAVDVEPSTIHRYEHGEINPSLEMLARLAGALGVRPSDLLCDVAATSIPAEPEASA